MTTKNPSQISEKTLQDTLECMVEVLSGKDSFRVEHTPVELAVQESDTHLLSIPINWSSNDLIVAKKHCDYLIPLLQRYKDVLSQAREVKRDKAHKK